MEWLLISILEGILGNVTGVKYTNIYEHEYYRNNALKNEISGFAKAIYKINQFEILEYLQLRNIDYKTYVRDANAEEGMDLKEKWTLFNPKIWVNYQIENGKIFLSHAHATESQTETILFANPNTKPEKLHDFELGLEKTFGNVIFYCKRLLHELCKSIGSKWRNQHGGRIH